MVNVLTLFGALVMGGGLVLILSSLASVLRVSRKWWRSRKPPVSDSVWGMAQTAGEVYVPGSVRRKLAMALLGVAIVGLGAPFAWAGHALGDFVLARSPARLAELWVEGRGTKLVVKPEGGVSDGYPRPGPLLVAHTENLAFPPWLATVGLGPYFRLVQIGGYDSSLQVLERRGRGVIDIMPTHVLFRRLEWVATRLPWLKLEVRRRFSLPLSDGIDKAELWAIPGEAGGGGDLEWRR